MCDPTVLAVGSLVAGAAGTAADYIGQSNAADQQKQAYDQWAAQQEKNRAEQKNLQEQERQKADVARAQGLQDVSADNQKSVQQQEQDRLTAYLQGNQNSPASNETNATPVSIADARLSGQQSGDETFQSDLAAKLNTAAQDTKRRIAALATVGSYGGSSGGLDVSNALAFQKAGMGIDKANDFRRGDLAAYQTEQAVEPLQISYTKSPFAGLAQTALQLGSQGLGGSLGKMFAGSVKL